jgi:1-acyl-sn-glycerol-3-phosphate acyltransferase
MLRSLWALFVMVTGTIVLAIPAILASLLYRPSYATLRLGRVWSWLILKAGGVRVRYEGLDHVARRAPRIYVANHQSFLDIWSTALVLPAPTLFVAKRSLFRLPFIGWAMSAAGFVAIDRSSRASAIRSLKLAADRIRAGRSLILFPEGTRSRHGRLGPFKKGPFHLALEARVPVVPVAICGSWHALPRGSLLLRPATVRVRFAPPLEVTPFLPDDVDGLAARVRVAIAERLESAGADPARAHAAAPAS